MQSYSRTKTVVVAITFLALAACGPSETQQSTKAPGGGEATKIAHAPQEDLSRFMPSYGRISSSLVADPLLGVAQFPGGTVAEYKKGGKSFQQILFKAPNLPMTAAYLGYGKDAMTQPKFVASFGGYYGEIHGKPVFLFVKNEYVAGLVGLSLQDADAEGRIAAASIP